jgi:hypothetical protein
MQRSNAHGRFFGILAKPINLGLSASSFFSRVQPRRAICLRKSSFSSGISTIFFSMSSLPIEAPHQYELYCDKFSICSSMFCFTLALKGTSQNPDQAIDLILRPINIQTGEQMTERYLKIHPKGTASFQSHSVRCANRGRTNVMTRSIPTGSSPDHRNKKSAPHR